MFKKTNPWSLDYIYLGLHDIYRIRDDKSAIILAIFTKQKVTD